MKLLVAWHVLTSTVQCQLLTYKYGKGYNCNLSLQNIQLICSYLDCVDIIALITGYYKVYVDNTSNTPLPVENGEKWPFSFRRESPANDGRCQEERRLCTFNTISFPVLGADFMSRIH